MAEGNGMKLSAFFSRSIHKCCMYYEVSTRTTQDSRSHLLNSQKQHVVAILGSLIFQWTSKAIACRWLIYLANNKHGKPRASRVKVLPWALFMEQNLRSGLLWAGFDQFGGVWNFKVHELVFVTFNLFSCIVMLGPFLYYVRVFWGFFETPTHLRKDIYTT